MITQSLKKPIYSKAFVLFATFFMVFSGRVVGAEEETKKEQKTSKEVLREPVAKINGVDILFRDLIVELDRVLPRKFHGKQIKKQGEKFKMRALWNLIWREILYQEGKRQNISVEDEVTKRIEEIRKKLNDEGDSLERLLDKVALSKEEWRIRKEKKYMEQAIQKKMFKVFREEFEQELTEAELRSYYEENKKNYQKPVSLRLREILLKIDPGGGDENWSAVKAQAEDLKRRAKAGEDFAELAREYSQDDFAKDGGDVGFLHVGGVASEVVDVAMHFEQGEIGGPVWTLYGYYIFKVEEKTPAVQLAYSEVKDQVKKELIGKKLDIRKVEWVNGLREKAKIEIFETPMELFPSEKEPYLIPQLEEEDDEKIEENE